MCTTHNTELEELRAAARDIYALESIIERKRSGKQPDRWENDAEMIGVYKKLREAKALFYKLAGLGE